MTTRSGGKMALRNEMPLRGTSGSTNEMALRATSDSKRGGGGAPVAAAANLTQRNKTNITVCRTHARNLQSSRRARTCTHDYTERTKLM